MSQDKGDVPLILKMNKGKLRTSKGELQIENSEGQVIQRVRLLDISDIVLYGNITVTTPTLQACAERDIPISYHDGRGWYLGSFQPVTGKNVLARAAQFRSAFSPKHSLALAQKMVGAKIHNCRVLLMRNSTELPESVRQALATAKSEALHAPSLEVLRGIEGRAAALYFQSFNRMLKGELGFRLDSRNRRPPKDPVNAMLSFGYGCLLRAMTHAILHVGLDPWCGFLHSIQAGRASLALDLMEAFRPVIVDALVIKLINLQCLCPQDFEVTGEGVRFSKSAKSIFLRQLTQKMNQEILHPVLERRVPYQECLEIQVRLLMKQLNGELQEYPEFMIR